MRDGQPKTGTGISTRARERRAYLIVLTVDWHDRPGNGRELEDVVRDVVDFSTAREAIGDGIADYGHLTGLYCQGEIATYEETNDER